MVKVRYYAPENMDDSKDIKGWTQYFYNLMHSRLVELDLETQALNKALGVKS